MEWPPPLKLSEFTFDEDLFLLSVYFTEPEEILKEQLVLKYEAAHAKDATRFPKQQLYNESTNILISRLFTLIGDERYANYREALVRVLGVEPIPVSEDEELQRPILEERALLTEEAQKYGKDKLRVILPGASLPSFVTRRVELCQNSDLLAREALAANENLTQEDQTLQIMLTEDELSCPVPHTPPHFSTELFERFLLFTRHPLLLSEIGLLDEAVDGKVREGELLYEQICDFFTNKRRNRVQILDSWKVEMEKAAIEEIIEEFTEAIEATRLKYERLATQVVERLNDEYCELLNDTMEFYEVQQHVVQKAIQETRIEDVKNEKLLEKRADLVALEDSIFAPPDVLPGLLVLGVALESRPFVLACEQKLAENLVDHNVYTKFIFAECQLISSSIMEQILSKCSDATLAVFERIISENGSCKLFDFASDSCKLMHRELYGGDAHVDIVDIAKSDEELTIKMLQMQKESSDELQEMMRRSMKNELLPLELVTAEIRTRRDILKNKYAEMSDARVRELINAGSEPFPEVLEGVLDERVESALGKRKQEQMNSPIALLPSSDYEVLEDGKRVAVNVCNRYVRIRPNKLLSSETSNLAYGEVYVENCNQCTIAVGVFLAADSHLGVFVTTDGYLQDMAKRRYLGYELPERCVFGILVNCRAELIEFRVNGQRIEDTDGHVVEPISFDRNEKPNAKVCNRESPLVKHENGHFSVEASAKELFDITSVYENVVPTISETETFQHSHPQDCDREVEFYIGSEVYSFNKHGVEIEHIYSEPFMMRVPTGYGDQGWI